MNTKVHFLKTLPEYFQAVKNGTKTFEIRKDDRDFKVGDICVLEEYDGEKQELTGEQVPIKISYKLEGGKYGLEEGYCILGFNQTYSSIKHGERL